MATSIKPDKRKVKHRLRVQGFLIFCAMLAILFLSRFLFPRWKGEFWDETLDITGILLVMFGFLLRMASRGHKKVTSRSGTMLITDGPYGLIRHPMYMGSFLIGGGLVLMLFNIWAAVILVAVFLAIYIPHFNKEESDLKERFPDQYEAYAQRTPPLFPRVSTLWRLREYIGLKWAWFKDEWVSVVFVFALIFAVELWQDLRSFGWEELIKEPIELLGIVAAFLLLVWYFAQGAGSRSLKYVQH